MYVGALSPRSRVTAQTMGSYAMLHLSGDDVPPIPMERSSRRTGPMYLPREYCAELAAKSRMLNPRR